ncbi:MAG: hypothetical protein RJA36_1126 [Pseudomonadota bacterium]|jgi:hypothetical protein
MKIILKKSDHLDDWYTIVRAEHDGREWLERIGPSASRFMCSERLSPEACIEGTAEEMIELAEAIKARGAASFKRCAVRVDGENAYFCSPKNSERDAVVPLANADEFAAQVFAELHA